MPTEAIVIDPSKLGDLQKVLRKAKKCIRLFRGVIINGNNQNMNKLQWQSAMELSDEVLAEANALGVPDNGD